MLTLVPSCTATADTDSGQKSSALLEKQKRKPLYKRLLRALPFSTHSTPLGYLKAHKKKPGSRTQGLIMVNCLNNIETLDKQLTPPLPLLFAD